MTATASLLRTPALASRLRAARVAFDAAVEVPVGSLVDAELPDALTEAAELEARASALKHALLAEADRRRVAEAAAHTGTDAWAARLTGTTRSVMAGGIWLARLLQDRYAVTRDAFAAGGINEAQARVIVRAAERMPAEATEEERRAAETALVAKAVDGMDPRRLRQAGRRMLEVVNRRLADQQEAAGLADEERRAEVETWLTLHDNGDGTTSGRFVLPELHGQLLRTALERLSAPRRRTRNAAGEPVMDLTLPGGGPGLNYTERLGAAFCELLEHLPSEGHGPVAATLLVHVPLEHLRDDLGAAGLDTGARISAGEARRLACNAGIVPLVLGGRSEPLDVGRTRRLHTKAQRQALSVLHDSCAAEGCDRPFAWTEIHHPHAWSDGGVTSIENALPLCGWHHRRAHDPRYRITFLPTRKIRFRLRR